jgi:hypothetical protein
LSNAIDAAMDMITGSGGADGDLGILVYRSTSKSVFANDAERRRNVLLFIEEYTRYGKVEQQDDLLEEAGSIFDTWLEEKDVRQTTGTQESGGSQERKIVKRDATACWWDRFEEILSGLHGPFVGFQVAKKIRAFQTEKTVSKAKSRQKKLMT